MIKTKTIVFLLFPKTHLLDLSGPAQVFYEANEQGQEYFQLYFAKTEEQIQSHQGLDFTKLRKMENIVLSKGDLICIPGIHFKSFCKGELNATITKVKPWVKEQYHKGVYLSSICSGAMILAKMGLLDHMNCTTHWKCFEYSKKHFPKAHFLDDKLYVFDKNIFTSAGMTAGIDMSLRLIEIWYGPLLAAKIAQEMVINLRRADTKDQKNIFLDFDNHLNEDVYRAQELLSNNLHVGFTLQSLANHLNKSTRQLSRLFKHHTGQSIQAYRDQLRLRHGEQLLLNSKMYIKEIAVECGYSNSRQFLRLWNKHKKITPENYRRKMNGVLKA